MCASGMSSLVRFAARMPAMRAVGQHVGLLQPVAAHERDDLGGRVEPALGDRDPARDGLAADVDHACAAVVVEVGERGHRTTVSTTSRRRRAT